MEKGLEGKFMRYGSGHLVCSCWRRLSFPTEYMLLFYDSITWQDFGPQDRVAVSR